MRRIIHALIILFFSIISNAFAADEALRLEPLKPQLQFDRPLAKVVALGAEWRAGRIAELDSQLITAIAEGRRRQARREIEPKINALLGNLCRGEPDKTDLQKLSGAILSVQLRRAYHTFPLRTERDEMQNTPLAQIDLALGRHLARYADALASGDDEAQVAVLQEMLSGLLVLSADQVNEFAEQLGDVLDAYTAKLVEECNTTQQHMALSVTINPALLVFDLAKYRGFNATHRWLEQQTARLRHTETYLDQLYTFDPVAGVLLSFKEPNLLLDPLDKLIDPDNIAFGHCSLGQMASAGAASGQFGCSLGPQCKPGVKKSKRDKGGLFGFDLSRFFGIDKSADKDIGPERSPFGVPTHELAGNCFANGAGASGSSSGGSSAGGGAGGPFGRQGGGFAQCMANAVYQQAVANDPARCILAAQQKLQDARSNETIIVGKGKGGPVIRGVYGNDSCTTDPRMSSPGGNKKRSSSNLMQQRINETISDLRKKDSAARAFLQSSTEDDLSESDFLRVSNELEENSRVCNDCLDEDTYGETEPREGKWREANFTFDAENHENESGDCDAECYFEMLLTVWHEATHAAENLDRSEDASHEDIEASEDTAKDAKDTAEETRDQARKVIEDMKGSDDTTMPAPGQPYEPCGPVAEAYRDMMACTGGQVAGMDDQGNPIPAPDGRKPGEDKLGGGLGNTDGNVDPTEEQWINGQYGNNAFSSCMASEGMTVVGDNGRVYHIGGNQPSRESCGTITCRPPAEPKVVNGTCRCVVEGQRGRIAAIIARHERTQRCGRMTVDCSRTPHSPCCQGQGGNTGIKPDLGPKGPGGDPSVFKPDRRKLDINSSLPEKLDLKNSDKPEP